MSLSGEINIAKTKISNETFNNLKRITNLNENDRTDGAVILLRHLFNQEKDVNEYWYTLKRLIRGCGSSTTECRSSFFTCLVGFLNFSTDEYPSCDQILKIAEKELCSKPEITSKEDSDAITGMILVCGAIVRSKKKVTLNSENISHLTKLLMRYSKCKSYHQFLAYIFCIELIKIISEDHFVKCSYSTIKAEIEQCKIFNIGVMYLMLEVIKCYPHLEVVSELKTAINGLARQNNFDDIANSLLNNKIQNFDTLPVFEVVCNFLANCEFFEPLWQQSIEPRFNNTKNFEISILRITTIIFTNSTKSLSYILSNSFIKLLANGLKSRKEEKVEIFYKKFFDALFIYCNKIETTNTEKLNIIKKLILYPGLLNLEKYTNQKIIHQIISKCDESSFIELYSIYKQIFLNQTEKYQTSQTSQWSLEERTHAGNMMQYLLNHKIMQSSYKWKQQEMKLIMILGFFHTDKTKKIIENLQNSDINDQLADQMKNIFFCSLQNRFLSLENENKVLYYLAQTCNEVLNKKKHNEFFRFNIKENLVTTWNEMFKEIQKIKLSKSSKKDNDKLDYVFNILLMHMGLQLFKDSEMAEAAIVDLKICLKKSKEKIQQELNVKENLSNFEEPNWIEVVVDLFLHLLSQNSNSLRNIVKMVFPHLCESMTLSSMNQILEILVVKDELKPLMDNKIDVDTSKMEYGENSSNDTSSENSDSDNDLDIKEESNDESGNDSFEENVAQEPTEAEKFRSAISQALIKNNINNDAESIDLDEMSEGEGRKLDEILSEVFKMKNNSLKSIRSKDYRTESTAIMHFQIRVLDLVDIYIQNEPSLLITLEIIISLLNTFKYYIDDESIPLQRKVHNILNKITSLKKFSKIEEVDNLFDYFSNILLRKFKSVGREQSPIHCKCVLFVINLNNILKQDHFDEKVISVMRSCVEDFLKSKSAKVNTAFLNYLFQANWSGVWKLGVTLIKTALDPAVISYKRIQILDFLELLYKNSKISKLNGKSNDKYFKIIETKLEAYLEYFINQKLSSKEFNKLINCLHIITNFHTKNNSEIAFNKNNLCKNVQILRQKINLESSHSYVRFCINYNLQPITNKEDFKLNGLPTKRKRLEKQKDAIKMKKAKT